VCGLSVYWRFHLPAWKHLLTPEWRIASPTEKTRSGGEDNHRRSISRENGYKINFGAQRGATRRKKLRVKRRVRLQKFVWYIYIFNIINRYICYIHIEHSDDAKFWDHAWKYSGNANPYQPIIFAGTVGYSISVKHLVSRTHRRKHFKVTWVE
jgi:hypothetical protein